jgi:hypothetical protein
MKNILSTLFIAVFLFCAQTAFAQTTSDITATGIKDSDGWEKYYSSQGGFDIFLPAKPSRESESMDVAQLGKRELVLYTSGADRMVFMVGFIDFKIPLNDPAMLKVMYDNWRDGVKEGLPGGDLTEKDGTFEGKPSREILYTTDVIKTHGRTFYIKGKMFQLMAMYARTLEDEVSAKEITRITDKFFNSFQLNEGAKKTTPVVSNRIVSDGVYRDEYFKFTLNLPKDWIMTNQDDIQIINENSKERQKVYSKNTQKFLENSSNRTTILFSISRNEFGAADNTSLIGAAEVDINKGGDLLLVGKVTETNFSKNMGYTITSKARWTKVGSVSAIVIGMERKVDLAGLVKQKLYLIRSKGYLLEFVITYQKDEDTKIPEEALQTFKFIK